jgi:hypothetical protein
MFLNKRGLLPTLVLMFTLICFGAALFYFSEAMDNQKGYIGAAQADFSNLLVQAEADTIYSQHALDQRFGEMIINFAEGGAMFPNSPDAFDNTRYWEKGGIECYPDLQTIENNFVNFLNLVVIRGYYDFEIIFQQGGGMDLILKHNKEYNITGSNYNIEYLPSMEIVHKSDYDFSLFLENIDKVKNVVNECGSDNICWEEKAEFYWEEDNKVFKFELISGKIADAFGEKEVMLSAAVDFNDINLLAGDEFKCSD